MQKISCEFKNYRKQNEEKNSKQIVSRGRHGLEMSIPTDINTTFKAYMDYKIITSQESEQYKFQQKCWTDEQGFRRYGDSYCVALSTYYSTNIGEQFEVTLSSNKVFIAVVSDIKSNLHTDERNMYKPMSNGNGNVIEFIIDKAHMDSEILKTGTVCGAGMEGSINKIVKLGRND